MKTPSRLPQHRKPTATRQVEIADAAMRIIAGRGPRGFTARALAREVGVTDGALFRHFASMDDIVGAVVERMESMLFGPAAPADEDPIDRLGTFFRRRVEAIAQNPPLSRLLLTDQLAQLGGPGHVDRIADLKRRTRRFIQSCLLEAETKGLLSGGLGPREGAVLVQGAVFALAHAKVGEGDVERMSEKIWSALESLLRGTHHRPPIKRKAR